MKADIEGPCGAIARADAVRQVVMMREMRARDAEVRRKVDELTAKNEEIQHLQQQLQVKCRVTRDALLRCILGYSNFNCLSP